MKKMFLIFFVCLHQITALCQNAATGTVVYIDSTAAPCAKAVETAGNYNEPTDACLTSRQGKFNVRYVDNSFMTEGVKRCLRMALDAWEDKLNISVPINFNLTVSDDLDPKLAIRTTVAYAGYGESAMPTSLLAQITGSKEYETSNTIEIYANADWKTSWDNDGTQWGTDNLQTALMRHIAHLLGFGTTVAERGGTLAFAINGSASPFDRLVSNGRQTLGSMAISGTPSQITDFFKTGISVSTPSASYRLFSSATGYVPYRSGNYFSLPTDNILNYPYCDRSTLQPINGETLDVMAAIGWDVCPHDIHIYGNDTDLLGYGSLYADHTFYAEDATGSLINGAWTYQVYDNTMHTYVDRASGRGTDFAITPAGEGTSYMDEFACLQGRVTFTTDGQTYTLPLTLNARPLFVDYSVANVQKTAGSDYYNFDLTLTSRGVTGGDVIVSSDYGTSATLPLNAADEQTLHVANALKIGPTYLIVSLTNGYGTTERHITLNLQSSGIQEVIHPDELFDVYTLQGIQIGISKRLSDLDKGTYIIKSATQSRKSKKIIVK